VVKCAGGHQEAKDKYRYFGIQTCTAANIVGGGHKACQYGCLGFGDCVKACSFGALTMDDNGLPVVNDEKCTGCGMCVPACPKKIISMIPASAQIYIACSSLERGKDVKEVCIVGCTGCGLCAQPKVCPSGAIKMEGYLPVVDYSKEDNLIVPKYKCPTNSFIDKIKYRPKFNIDPNCNSCGECLKICPVKNCIKGEEGKKFEIDQDLCIGCGWCVPVCEPRAIHIIGAIAYQQQAVA
jgi:ferredoxin